MTDDGKQISNSYATGGGGIHFENRVQASFVALMLTGGFAPCLPTWPITGLKLQGKYKNFDTDDLIVHVKDPKGKKAKLLGQVKHSIKITKGNKEFAEVLHAAWADFNKQTFSEGTDIIALITGPLSATDTTNVRSLLNQAEHSTDAQDFIERISLAKFTSDQQRAKFEVFKTHLKNANRNIDLTDNEIWRFLKNFRLLIYDLDIKGVTLSLLHSLIGQYSPGRAQDLLSRIEKEVTYKSENAGYITLDSIPEDLRAELVIPVRQTIPADFVQPQSTDIVDWNVHEYASKLVFVNLIGSWNESNSADTNLISELVGEDYREWIVPIRDLLQDTQSPMKFNNGVWSTGTRRELWKTLGSRIFDEMLDSFKECAVTVLTERHPKFELSPEDRFAAPVYGKSLRYSDSLRKGIVETLALLGNQHDALTNCTLNKPEFVARSTVQKIFESADWTLWGSLDRLLPALAETAPDAFLTVVEDALNQRPCPFEELYSQEGTGFSGGTYMAGLLWALEVLAWDEQYLVGASVVLGDLGARDPGGNWSNRPANSLSTIFLPWLPQTRASVEKRRVAVETVTKECPEVGWKLLLSLLPNQQQMSSGSYKPEWRQTLPPDSQHSVTWEEYWTQVEIYSEMLVREARHDLSKLSELINHLDHLPRNSLDRVIEFLQTEDIKNSPEHERLELWSHLQVFVLRHKRFSDAKWALDSSIIGQLEDVVKVLAPSNPLLLHRLLFDNRDSDLFVEVGKWELQQQQLETRRKQAVKDILTFDGINAVFQFARTVESPAVVGYTLGTIGDTSMDLTLLPELLQTEEKLLEQLATAYIWGRYITQGWSWVDRLDKGQWSDSEIGKFLYSLPFEEETWKRVSLWLGDSESIYWTSVNINPFQANAGIEIAIDKLMEYGRPNSAISCLHKNLQDGHSLDIPRATGALLKAASSSEFMNSLNAYNVVELINVLQQSSDADLDDISQIEWAYLPLLDGYQRGVRPKTLESHLASDPSFFSEIISLVYRPKGDVVERKLSEQQRAMAQNAYQLLREWRIPPGVQSDGRFIGDEFTRWLLRVREICSESGHLEVALSHVGQVLIFCPSDPGGLWIDSTVARALNAKDAKRLRDGYYIGVLNSRGVHTIDPSGGPERELAEEYRSKANDVEDAGYQRLAVTLRDLSRSYDLEAEQIVSKHKYDD